MMRHIPLPSQPPAHSKDWKAIYERMITTLPLELHPIQDSLRSYSVQSTGRDTIYTGLSGIALTEYHLSRLPIGFQDERLSPKGLTSSGDQHLARAIHHHPSYRYSATRLSFIETNVGVATLVLCRGLWTSEQTISGNWAAAKEYLETVLDQVVRDDAEKNHPEDGDDGCEVLYGRAGLLYALLYLQRAIIGKPPDEVTSLSDLTSDSHLSFLIDSIISRGMRGSSLLSSELKTDDQSHTPPLMWMWYGRRYLGGAHGVAGILQILLTCPEPLIEKHVPMIMETLLWLIDCQDEQGNWPSKCPTERHHSVDNELNQWCHGAPGMIILLSTALRILHSHDLLAVDGTRDKISRSLRLGAEYVYQHGLLRKGVGLCHGVAGSVYALLAASDALDTASERSYFTKAAHLAFLATFREDMTSSKQMHIPDHPWSLYEGLAGACCAWAEVLSRLASKDPRRSVSGFPGYNDLS